MGLVAASDGGEIRLWNVVTRQPVGQVMKHMAAALLDRLTHRCHLFEMNGESYRFRESMKVKKARKGEAIST